MAYKISMVLIFRCITGTLTFPRVWRYPPLLAIIAFAPFSSNIFPCLFILLWSNISIIIFPFPTSSLNKSTILFLSSSSDAITPILFSINTTL
ncbi:hypothetical protein D3C73_1359490 [compost metagenome]